MRRLSGKAGQNEYLLEKQLAAKAVEKHRGLSGGLQRGRGIL